MLDLQKSLMAENTSDDSGGEKKLVSFSFHLPSFKFDLNQSLDDITARLLVMDVQLKLALSTIGSKSCLLSVKSLQVQDHHTVDSSFPYVVKERIGGTSDSFDEALKIDINVRSSGDGELTTRFKGFNVVICDSFISGISEVSRVCVCKIRGFFERRIANNVLHLPHTNPSHHPNPLSPPHHSPPYTKLRCSF